MRIALFQTKLSWENPGTNRKFIEEYFLNEDELFDLFVLPEMFTTGFTMNPSAVAESMEGDTLIWLKGLAKKKSCAITGSLVIKENDNYYNRMVFVFPSGAVQFYDKRHLFTLAGEDKVYTRGTEKLIVNYNNWNICLQICYDLRFPVFVRNVENYDLLLYVANWPKPRINAWDILLKARAIENMCYLVGVNRLGADANDLEYPGHSKAVDFLGNSLVDCESELGVFVFEIDKKSLEETRQKLNFLSDRDDFSLI
ncbi:nitrilase family protein [Flavobacterium cucumis]|uniref:Omega-amidase YafV n=1 Tax=Flavobacterium cucumis TaxID=416016 RepID=A0A1M7ZUU2_9FLAO|nr:nitrilase family protein [Flavobacterium cucumis]SHO72626.1 Predicted amidohydrolase [Flavobacterium cucumis]